MHLTSILSNAAPDMIAAARSSVVQVKAGGRGIGTGVIWRSAPSSASAVTEIVTNAHVVARTKQISVVTADSVEHEAAVVSTNGRLDLALLRIESGNHTPAAVSDSAALRVGEWVYAIGNPWGQVGVVTRGVISMIGSMEMRDGRRAQYLRSDVELAPGNSGGPLLNAAGEVVGINAMIMGGDQSVAIPSGVVIEWIAGQPDRPVRLGISVQPVRLPSREPALMVMTVDAQGPAAQSLMVGDVLLGVGDEDVRDADALQVALARSVREHGRARLRILRGGARREIGVAL
jgi:serine protease Do